MAPIESEFDTPALDPLVHLMCTSLGCGGEAEHPEKTTQTWENMENHTETVAQPGGFFSLLNLLTMTLEDLLY